MTKILNKFQKLLLYSTEKTVKGIYHQKNEILLRIYSPSYHQKCRWVCFFIRTDFEKCSIIFAYQWKSSAVHGCRQNEKQTVDKSIIYIQVIHTAPVHQLFMWLGGSALRKRLWVQFPGNTHTDKRTRIAWMHCKSLWIKASAECINVNYCLVKNYCHARTLSYRHCFSPKKINAIHNSKVR